MAEPRPLREGILLQAFAVQQLSGDLLRAELGDLWVPSYGAADVRRVRTD